MDKEFFNILVLPAALRPEELEPRLAGLAKATGLEAYTLRQKLSGRGAALLSRSADREEMVRLSGKLKEAGLAHHLFTDSEFRGLAPAGRAVGLRTGPDRVDFLDSGGQVINSLSREDECLVVCASLERDQVSPREFLEKLGQGEEEIIKEVVAGEAVLDIYPRVRPPRVRIFTRRFNFTSLAAEAGPSGVQNTLKVIALIRARTARTDLDFSCGFSAPPPLPAGPLPPARAPDLPPAGRERLEGFEARSRLLALAFDAGLRPLPAPARSAPAEKTPPVPAALPPVSVSRFRIWLDRVSYLGPPALFLPLFGLLLLFGGGLYLTEDMRFLPPAGIFLGLIGFAHGFVALKRARKIENIPTARIRSLPMGLVEVTGKALSGAPLKTPFSLIDCVWYRYEVQEYQHRSGRGRTGGYVTVGGGNSESLPFCVEDETGRVTVDPRGAVVEVTCRQVTYQGPPGGGGMFDSGKKRRIIEHYIPWRYPVYVIGTARPAPAGPETGAAEVLARLRELKKSPEKLAAFDLDRDGRIAAEEWEKARARVEEEVLREKLARPSAAEQVFIGRGEEEELYLIADRSERELVRGLKLRAGIGVFGGGALALAALYWGLRILV